MSFGVPEPPRAAGDNLKPSSTVTIYPTQFLLFYTAEKGALIPHPGRRSKVRRNSRSRPGIWGARKAFAIFLATHGMAFGPGSGPGEGKATGGILAGRSKFVRSRETRRRPVVVVVLCTRPLHILQFALGVRGVSPPDGGAVERRREERVAMRTIMEAGIPTFKTRHPTDKIGVAATVRLGRFARFGPRANAGRYSTLSGCLLAVSSRR